MAAEQSPSQGRYSVLPVRWRESPQSPFPQPMRSAGPASGRRWSRQAPGPWVRPANGPGPPTALNKKMVGSHVLTGPPWVEDGLDVSLGEHAAAGGAMGVDLLMLEGEPVQLVRGDRSSRVAIWSMKAPVPPAQEPFMRSSGGAAEEDDLGVLAAQLDDGVGGREGSTPGRRTAVA